MKHHMKMNINYLKNIYSKFFLSINKINLNTITLTKNIAFAFFGRFINMFSNLIAIPLVIHSIGQKDYAIVSVAISISSFFAFADFGLGSALVNDISDINNENILQMNRTVTQTWIMLWSFAIILIITYVAYSIINTNLNSYNIYLDRNALTIIALSSALGIPMAITQRIYFSLREGGKAQFWQTMSRASVVMGCLYCFLFNRNTTAFVFCFTGLPTTIFSISTAYLFIYDKSYLRPNIVNFNFNEAKSKLKLGISFMVLQVCTFLETGIDPLIVGRYFSKETVSKMDLSYRPFSYVPALLSIGLGPIWPSLTSAAAIGDWAWIRKATFLGYSITTILAGITSVLIYLFIDLILKHWLGYNINVDHKLVFFIGLFTCLQSVGLLQLMMMNAFGLARQSAAIAIAFAIFVLPLKIFFIYKFGPVGGFIILNIWYFIKIVICFILIKTKIFKIKKQR